MRKVRFGVVGTNFITDWVIAGAKQDSRFELAAVCSRTEERGRDFASRYGIPEVYTSLEAMVSGDCVDAVYIATPNFLHASQSILCMSCGKHVLCEKPLASTAAEAREMLAASERYNVTLMEAMKPTLTPNFKSVMDNIGKAGKVRRYFSSYCQYSSRYDRFKAGEAVNAFRLEYSNGAIMDIGVYTIYPMVVLFGMPDRISASGTLLSSGTDGQGSALFRYGDGMEAAVLYSKIADFTDTYSGTLRLKKEVECGNRKTVYAITVEDERKEEEFLRETSGCKDQLDRIEGILRTLEIYLASPLMEFVGKAPLLKPPITETNVLKMNKNFKAAKELYHFIASYEGDGFSVKREKICLHPFSESVAEEFAEAAELIGFLAYEHGSGQEEVFSKRYADYLRELKRNEEEKERQNLKMLKKRVAETGKGAEEYMLALENKVRELETQCMEIPEMKAQTEKAVSEIERLQKERKEADEARFQSERLLAETRTEHLAETARIRADYESRLLEESRRAKEECARLEQRHAEELSVKETEYSEKLQTAEAGFEQKLSEYRENERKEKQEADKKLQGLTEENEQLQKEAESNREEAKRWEREKLLSDARMNALKREYGVFTGKEDFTSRESFNEIEKQYQTFRSFFKEEWKKTKKRIKNEILHPAAEKEKDSSAQEDKTFDQANGKESGE